MRPNIPPAIRFSAKYWVQAAAPGADMTWNTSSISRGLWIDNDIDTMVQRFKSGLKEEIVTIRETINNSINSRGFALYGIQPTDKRRKRYRILLTFRDIRAIHCTAKFTSDNRKHHWNKMKA